MVWKSTHLLFAILFLGFAFVQVNDPDPVLWILIYGATSVACMMAAFRYYQKVFLIFLTLSFSIYLITLFPGWKEWYFSSDRSLLFDDLAKMQYDYIEEAREFLGLLICTVCLIVFLIRSFSKRG